MSSGSPPCQRHKDNPSCRCGSRTFGSEHPSTTLSLVLGAGVSFDAKVPLWGKLVSRLAEAAGISEQRLAQHQKERFPERSLLRSSIDNHHAEYSKSSDNPPTVITNIGSIWLGSRRFEIAYIWDVGTKTFEEIAKEHSTQKV